MGYRPFESLKELLQNSNQHNIHNTPSDNEIDLFKKAMADVKEIKEFQEIPYKKPRRRVIEEKPHKEIEDVYKILYEIVNGKRAIPLHLTQEYIEWTDAGLSREIAMILHSGKLSVQDYIDLHGCSLEEAKIELREFLKTSILKGYSCVKIIHGRGLRSKEGPKLKKSVMRWLEGEFRGWAMAYVTARACDGGTGAIYVLLKDKVN